MKECIVESPHFPMILKHLLPAPPPQAVSIDSLRFEIIIIFLIIIHDCLFYWASSHVMNIISDSSHAFHYPPPLLSFLFPYFILFFCSLTWHNFFFLSADGKRIDNRWHLSKRKERLKTAKPQLPSDIVNYLSSARIQLERWRLRSLTDCCVLMRLSWDCVVLQFSHQR